MSDRLPGSPWKASSADRVREFLASRGLEERIVTFEGSTKTAQMAADAIGCELGQVVKSLAVTGDGGRAAVVLVAGDRRGDMGVIAAELGVESVRMASAEEVRASTGYSIGGVSPFDLPERLPVLVDGSLERYDVVYSAAGTPNSMVRLTIAELLAASGGRMASVSH